LFESVRTDDTPAARFRSAALPPVAAVLVTVGYLTVYRLLAHVPAALFWAIVAILRAVRRERPRGIALGWLAAAILADLLCARILLWLTLPWL
jgi:hypothetical protein